MKKLGFIVEMKDCKDAADLRRWVDLAQQQGIDGVELLFNSKCGVDFSLDKIKLPLPMLRSCMKTPSSLI